MGDDHEDVNVEDEPDGAVQDSDNEDDTEMDSFNERQLLFSGTPSQHCQIVFWLTSSSGQEGSQL